MGLPSRKNCLNTVDSSFLENEVSEKIKFECATCGSDEVEGKFWVDLNAEIPDMNDWDLNGESNYWCRNCSEQVEINEIVVKKPS